MKVDYSKSISNLSDIFCDELFGSVQDRIKLSKERIQILKDDIVGLCLLKTKLDTIKSNHLKNLSITDRDLTILNNIHNRLDIRDEFYDTKVQYNIISVVTSDNFISSKFMLKDEYYDTFWKNTDSSFSKSLNLGYNSASVVSSIKDSMYTKLLHLDQIQILLDEYYVNNDLNVLHKCLDKTLTYKTESLNILNDKLTRLVSLKHFSQNFDSIFKNYLNESTF